VSGSAAAATFRRSRRATTAPMRSSSAVSVSSGSRWAARRTKSPPPASSPVAPARQQRPRLPTNAPGCTLPPTRRRRRPAADPPPTRRRHRPASADGSASISPPNHQRPQILEPFFLPCLAGFLECTEEATKSRYTRRQRRPPQGLKDYSFFLSHHDQEAGGTYVESFGQLPAMYTE
jgi:hypothetical protein